MLNYKKLMAHKPMEYDNMANSKGQRISFLEHPTKGGMSEIICACHDLELAAYSTFFDLDDMMSDDKEYEPSFKDNKFYIGDYES